MRRFFANAKSASKPPQKTPKRQHLKRGKIFFVSRRGRPCASASWRHFAFCDRGATAQYSGVGDGTAHMAETRGIDSRLGGFSATGRCANRPVRGKRQFAAFSEELLDAFARRRADEPYKAPEKRVDEALAAVAYEQYHRAISFKEDHAIWRKDDGPFWLEPYHTAGALFAFPVELFAVDAGRAIEFRTPRRLSNSTRPPSSRPRPPNLISRGFALSARSTRPAFSGTT